MRRFQDGYGLRCDWRLAGVLMLSTGIMGCDLSKLGIGEIIEECGSMTLEELQSSGELSDECREALRDLLPEKETTLSNRIVVLGVEHEGNSATIYMHGVGSGSDVLTSDDFAAGSYTILDASGSESLLDASSQDTQTLMDWPDGILSMSLVTDYSSSMREEDLDAMADLYTDLVTMVPPVYEAEVVVFTTEVTEKQPYTESQEALVDAVAVDSDIERDLTALYDGMGHSLDNFSERTRPARLLVVATDGAENASEIWTQEAVIEAIADEDVVIVMVGSLFSDVEEFKTLTGDRGIYFYAADYSDIRDELNTWVRSLSEAVAVTIDGLPADAASVSVKVDGVDVTIDL